MLARSADNMTPLALSNGLSLIAQLPPNLPKVRADVTRLEQVLTNLMNNAIKFTPRGGKVTLSARDHGSNVVIEVKDTGPGMSERQKKHIFEPYRHPEGGVRVRPYGMGLGLALCKMFIDLHDGQIWVRSRLGKGSTFGFSLPVETPGTLPMQTDKPGKLWKVLIIEDNPQIVKLISLALEAEWPHAALLSTRMGEEGVDLVGTEHPDVVILDLGLPDKDGLDVLQEIRLFSSVPILVLTVRQEEQDITRALSLGANDYITKPFKMKELVARVKVQIAPAGAFRGGLPHRLRTSATRSRDLRTGLRSPGDQPHRGRGPHPETAHAERGPGGDVRAGWPRLSGETRTTRERWSLSGPTSDSCARSCSRPQ